MEPQSTARKRLKQACKNCRRKKARCPGERPICSFCCRLKQVCEYDDIQPTIENARSSNHDKHTKSKLSDRVAQLESRLSLIATNSHGTENISEPSSIHSALPHQLPRSESLDTVDHALPKSAQLNSPSNQPDQQTFFGQDLRSVFTPSKFQSIPPENVALDVIALFFRRIHNRPLTFFYKDSFYQKLKLGSIPSHLIRALLASTAAISLDPWFDNKQKEAADLIAQTAWLEILTQVLPGESPIEVTAIQSLGLLSHLDYRAGRFKSGNIKLRIAITLAQNLGLTAEPDPSLPPIEQEEQRCILWTLFLLDRITAAVLDRECVLNDKECLLKLPENEQAFENSHENYMPDLKQAKTARIPRDSYYAKLMLVHSALGIFMRTPIPAPDAHSVPFWHSRGGYAHLIEQFQHVTEFCKADIVTADSLLDDLKQQQVAPGGGATADMGYRMYTQTNYHILHIAINHPFFIRQQLSATDAPCPPEFLQQTLKRCQEHAETLIRLINAVQELNLPAQTGAFPGYFTYICGIVHFLFMYSPDLDLANKSRELFRLSQKVLLHCAATNGGVTQEVFVAMLEALQRNPGVASLLVDPRAIAFRYRAPSTSVWRMLDLEWLGEHLCVRIPPTSSMSILQPQERQRQQSTALTSSSEGTPSDSSLNISIQTPPHLSNTPVTPEQSQNITSEQNYSKLVSSDMYAFGSISQNLQIQSDSPMPDIDHQYNGGSVIYKAESYTQFPASIPHDQSNSQFATWRADADNGIQSAWGGISYELVDDRDTGGQLLSSAHPQEFSDEYVMNFTRPFETENLSSVKSVMGNKRYSSSDLY